MKSSAPLLALILACGTQTELDEANVTDAATSEMTTDVIAADVTPFRRCHDWSVPTAAACGAAPAPTVLYEAASGQLLAAIAVDAQNVYWIESGAQPILRSVSKCGGPPMDLATVGTYVPYTIVIRDGYVWWIGDSHLKRVATSGGPVDTLGTMPPFPLTFDFDGAGVFTGVWSDGGTSLVRYSMDGDSTQTLAPSAGSSFFRVCVDCAYVYFTVGAAYATRLAVVAKDGGAVERLPSKPMSPNGGGVALPGPVVMDNDALYWVRMNDAELQRVSKDGTSTVGLAEGAATEAVAVDDGNVYYLANDAIQRVSTSGGASFSVASVTTDTVVSLAVDQRSVYWSEDGTQFDLPTRISKIDK